MKKVVMVSVLVMLMVTGCSLLNPIESPQPGPAPETSTSTEVTTPVPTSKPAVTLAPTVEPIPELTPIVEATPDPVPAQDAEVMRFLGELADDIERLGVFYEELNQLHDNREDISLKLEEIKTFSVSVGERVAPEKALYVGEKIRFLATASVSFCDACLESIRNNERYSISELIVPVTEAMDEVLAAVEVIAW